MRHTSVDLATLSERSPRARVAPRWLAGLGIGIALGMLALGTDILLDTRQDAWLQAEGASHNLLLTLERDIARNFKVFDLSLQGVTEALAEPGIDKASPGLRRQALFDRAASAEDLGSILVLDRNGDVVEDSTSSDRLGLNFADRDDFRVHQGRADVGLYISRPYRSRLRNGDLSISVSRRLPAADGHFAGIVSGSLRLNFFRHLFEKLDVGANGSISLVRTDGRVIMRYPFLEADIDLDLSGADTFRHFAAAVEGHYTGTAAIDGVQRMYAFRHVGDLPLILAVSRGVDDVYAPWRRKALIIGGLLAALSLATMTLCLLFRREMLHRAAAETELKTLAVELSLMASIDGLTGLANRRTFEDGIAKEWRRSIRGDSDMALLMIDVDHFKPYNDTYGHQGGDEALRAVAARIADSIRRSGDLAARYGGEEFIVLLPETDDVGALFIAERIRADIEELAITHVGSPSGLVTVSVGVATARPHTEGAQDDLVRAADAALYAAKLSGRNRVKAAGSEVMTIVPNLPSTVDRASFAA